MLALDRRELLAVFAGGFAGVLVRAGLLEAWPPNSASWPWATFAVNLVAAVLLGYLITRLNERLPPSQYRRALLGTGFCGALSTFSTLAAQLLAMFEDGHALLACAYGSVSLAAGLAAVFLSTKLVRRARIIASLGPGLPRP